MVWPVLVVGFLFDAGRLVTGLSAEGVCDGAGAFGAAPPRRR